MQITFLTGRAKFARLVISLAFILLALPEAKTGSATTNPPSRYETRAQHDPNGLGQFYMEREIAQVMGHQGADWLERSEREKEEKPDEALKALKIKPGDAVADIGAGTGYYTRRLSKLVGDKGTVYAVDIQQEMLDLLTNKLAASHIKNVKPVLGELTDPKLPRASIDLALMVDVYHEFDHPYEMAQALCRSIETGRMPRVRNRISRGRSESSDQRSSQNERGAGEKGNERATAAMGWKASRPCPGSTSSFLKRNDYGSSQVPPSEILALTVSLARPLALFFPGCSGASELQKLLENNILVSVPFVPCKSGNHPRCSRRKGCVRAVAHRRRKIALLSIAGAGQPWPPRL